ncbi:unnamed protein product [Sphagnum jensenii]|uniref:Uncharacterized protein n=1 Tax=Sphagnum jensenii TaxID=128206 RepID=A0ABP0WVZ6_9BRYO
MRNHRHANHFFLPIHASGQPCQVQRLFRKVGYTAYFGVDHQNMELEGDPAGLHLKEQLEVGPFVNQPRFRTRSTCDRSRGHSPVLVEMHHPHVAGASNVAARSPPHPVVRSR